MKPIDLMRWLIRMVTPPGGRILDPFAGSGSTLCAAALEGVEAVGIEQDEGFVEIARARVAFWAEHGEGGMDEMRRRTVSDQVRKRQAEAGQLDLFGVSSTGPPASSS